MDKIQNKIKYTDQNRLNNIEAQKRLKEGIPNWLKDGWILNPVIIKIDHKGNKKCVFLTKDGQPKSPRIIIKDVKDFPPTANAILGTSSKYPVIDIDVAGFRLPDNFPLPWLIVNTGRKGGKHLYYANGDIPGTLELSCGQLHFKTKGVFIPGSYHAPSGNFYEADNLSNPKTKLFMKDIKPLLKKQQKLNGTMTEGNRNNATFLKMLNDMQFNQGKKLNFIENEAKKSGLDNQEIERIKLSATKIALTNGIDPGPQAPPKTKTKAKSKGIKDKKALGHITLIPENSLVTDTQWIIKNLFEIGALSIIAGMPNQGKTTLAIKIAVLNALGRPFWNNGPKGNKKPSLYVCFERKKASAINKIYSCGGDLTNIHIMDKIKIKNKEHHPDFSNTQHLQIIMEKIKTGDYAFVILDPLVNLELEGQNKNEAVRKKMEGILTEIENSDTCILGIMHLKKDRKFSDDLGSIRSASEWANLASCVHKIKELKDDSGFVMVKLKVNESDTGTRGGIKFKIESLEIPKMFIAPGQKETTKGGIRVLEYIDKNKRELDKETVKEFIDPYSDTPEDKIRRVIARLEAENKELNTITIKNLAKAEGVSSYFIRYSLNWSKMGYKTGTKGQGKEYRQILVKLD